MPTATAISSDSPSGTGTTPSSGTTTNSARHPTIARHHTRVPDGWTAGGDDLAHGLGSGDEGRLGSGM